MRPMLRARCGAVVATLAAAAACVLPSSQPARAATAGQLQQQISAGQSRISGLSGTVAAQSGRLSQLQGQIGALQHQIDVLQARIAPELAQEARLRVELIRARAQLQRLEALQAHAESILAQQLVGTYESDQPDLVTVVLDAKGFQDLLDRIAYQQTVQHQDAQVVRSVRATRQAVAAQAIKLGALEAHLQALTAKVLAQRNQLIRARLALVPQEVAAARARAATASQLAAVRSQVNGLQAQLSKIQVAQAAAAAQAAGLSPSAFSGPVSASSSGGFTFPVPKGAASPPGTWSLDQGVDIAAPGDTPELAVCSGTIVLHGIGGFGPDAPVLHCDSPVGGYSYVYYGHAGPVGQLPVGTHVSGGQVMSSVGPGIVGISTGPHIEIGFCDSSGSPLGTQTAPTMMSLLRSSYGG
jgi:murein DD-endopeptidase MepM/ murein hydrolase activator NlpD